MAPWTMLGYGLILVGLVGPLHANKAADMSTVTVTKFGADPAGIRDSAPAFRAALTDHRRLIVPPGRYLFNTVEPVPCCAFDRTAVLVQGLTDFAIDGDRATIVIGDKIALSSAFHFDRSRNFTVRGLTISGSRAGLLAKQENAGLAFTSDRDFVVQHIHFTGDFAGNGSGIVGDWLVDGVFRNITAEALGHCFDLAYLLRVRIDGVVARGAGAASGAPGQTCISVISDPPNAERNRTGVAFSTTRDVFITNVDEENFNTGALLAAGSGYVLARNWWHKNKPSGRARGIGVLVRHGGDLSQGVAKDGVRSVGDRFSDNEVDWQATRAKSESAKRP